MGLWMPMQQLKKLLNLSDVQRVTVGRLMG